MARSDGKLNVIHSDIKKLFHIGVEVESLEQQVSFGDAGNTAKRRYVYIHAHLNNQKYLIGKLHSKKLKQQPFDLVFDQPFAISHTWKHGSVYFLGYEQDVAELKKDILYAHIA